MFCQPGREKDIRFRHDLLPTYSIWPLVRLKWIICITPNQGMSRRAPKYGQADSLSKQVEDTEFWKPQVSKRHFIAENTLLSDPYKR